MTAKPPPESVAVRLALASEAPAIRAIREAAAETLATRYGPGHWSAVGGVETIRAGIQDRVVYVVLIGGKPAGTFTLTDRKLGFYKKHWFAEPAARAYYLFRMALLPERQRQGFGRKIMEAVERFAKRHGGRAVRLDAYEGPAGAGKFYRKCGYRLVQKGRVNGVALEYYEKALAEPADDQA